MAGVSDELKGAQAIQGLRGGAPSRDQKDCKEGKPRSDISRFAFYIKIQRVKY